MLNSLYIFILRVNGKQVSEGQYWLAIMEFLATVVCVAIVCNT